MLVQDRAEEFEVIMRCFEYRFVVVLLLLGSFVLYPVALLAAEKIDPSLVDNIKLHIPANYVVLAIEEGDLNRDPYPDILVILKHNKENEVKPGENDIPRPVLVLINEGDNKYRLAGRGDKAALCKTCGGIFGDPFVGVTVKKGFFTLEHYGGSAWRWTRYITFKYNKAKNNWFLHKDGGMEYHTSNPNKKTSRFKKINRAKAISLKQFNYDK